uniref:Mitochondrial import inner membrane translocase subunit n=1 Tax=Zooxanthella nutricula TaxID=1333877 RepID=A0A7S2VSU0_9DINO
MNTRGLSADSGMSAMEAMVFQARFETQQGNIIQKVCWERCADGLLEDSGSAVGSADRLPEPTRRCLDACVSKFADTAMLVSAESQLWQINEMRQQQLQQLTSRVALGLVASAAAVGLGAFLFKGGDD